MQLSSTGTPVSFGTDIMKPYRLQTRQIGDILKGIKNGDWRDAVERVRNLRGTPRENAKKSLPYFTPSGQFTYKRKDDLVRYSGIAVIDLDDLPPRKIDTAIQTAVVDRHCFAAFRSPSGSGLKLLFRVPRQLGDVHKEIFPQVAAHVRQKYRVEPDRNTAQADVCRACFVSWDAGAWIYTAAKELPIKAEAPKPAGVNRPTTQRGSTDQCLPEELEKMIGDPQSDDWSFQTLGWDNGPKKPKPNEDIHYTNESLLPLARRVASDIFKKYPDGLEKKNAERLLALAFKGWTAKARWRGVAKSFKGYWKELVKMFGRQMKSGHPEKNATHWTRWRKHADFPIKGTSREKIFFAILKDCEDRKTDQFYLSQRDAGKIAGISHVHAGEHLEKLRQDGRIAHHPGWLRRRPGKGMAQIWVLSVRG